MSLAKIIGIGVGFILIFSALALMLGSTSNFTLTELLILFANPGKSLDAQILWEIRMPALMTALCAGAGLSVAGLMMQDLFQNPLAGPSVMGITSGASLMVAIGVLAGIGSAIGLTALSMLGACAVMLIIVAASFRLRNNTTLLILGLMLGLAIGAVVSVLQFRAEALNLQQYIFWTLGTFHASTWDSVLVMLVVISIVCVFVVMMAKILDGFALGEEGMKLLGLSPLRWRVSILILTGLSVGVITAYCGPLAFIGITAPHLARMFLRTDSHVLLTPVTILSGMIMALIALIITANGLLGLRVPLNAILSILGAPVIIWLLIKKPSKGTSRLQ